MGTKRFVMAFVIVCLGLVLGMGTLASADSLQVNLVWEKEFDFPVVDFAIGEKTSGESYLKVVLTQSDYEDTGSVYFFDEEMGLITRVELSAMDIARISKSGEYVGVYDSCAMPTYEGCPVGRFTMYGSQGSQLWSMDSTWCAPEFYILGHGDRIACVDDWGGEIEFFDSQGMMLRLFSPFPHGPGPYPTGIVGDVSLDGRVLVLVAGPLHSDEMATVIRVDENGNELWRKQLAHSLAWEVSTSEHGNTIAVLAQNPSRSVYILSGSGTILHTYRSQRWSPFELSGDGEIFVGALTGPVVSVYSVETGQPMWEHVNPDTTQIFTSVDVSSGDSLRVLAGATTIDPTAGFWEPVTDLPRQVYLLGSSGERLWHREFSGAGYWSLEGPLVRFAGRNGHEFFVGNRKKVCHYVY